MKYAKREYLILTASMLAFTAVLFWLTEWRALPSIGAALLLLLIIPPTGLLLVRLWKSFSHGVSQVVNGLLLAFLFIRLQRK